MDDVSISDEGYLFGLSVYTPLLCSFNVVVANMVPIGCVNATDFSLEEYTGLSCKGGICVISGGTGGYTVVSYDRNSGALDSTLRCLNCRVNVDNILDNPKNYVEVALMNSRYGAFSVLGEKSYESIMVDLNINMAAAIHTIPDPVNERMGVTPTNFPCVSDFFRSSSGVDFLFTACGSITVQNALIANTTTIITPPVQNFAAVTLAVDSDQNTLVVGGNVLASGFITHYSIDPDDPSQTTLIATEGADQTILSLAVNGGSLGFMTSESSNITTKKYTAVTEPPSFAPSNIPSDIPSDISSDPPARPGSSPTTASAPSPTGRATSDGFKQGGILMALAMAVSAVLWL
jgi:hypothetical protein